ncbi:Glutamate--glyoxylate aminotransferase 2, partial [Chytridiales sp. JEL 0842]
SWGMEYAPNNQSLGTWFLKDAVERAETYLKDTGSTGVLSERKLPTLLKVARDGYPSNTNNIFLTAGASPGVQAVLQAIISHNSVGIMIPIPQYPLYTASIDLFNGRAVPYYLDKSQHWGMSLPELERTLHEACVVPTAEVVLVVVWTTPGVAVVVFGGATVMVVVVTLVIVAIEDERGVTVEDVAATVRLIVLPMLY